MIYFLKHFLEIETHNIDLAFPIEYLGKIVYYLSQLLYRGKTSSKAMLVVTSEVCYKTI